jgi:hypothetical protein
MISLSRVFDVNNAFTYTMMIAGVAQAIIAAQLLTSPALAAGKFLGWSTQRTQYVNSPFPPVRGFARLDIGDHASYAIAFCATLSGIALACFALLHIGPSLPLAITVFFGAALTFRVPMGRNAADQLLLITLIALLLGTFDGAAGMSMALAFIAAQSVLAYFTAGITKCRHRGWYDGSFVRALLMTETFGQRGVSTVVKRFPVIAVPLGSALLVAEVLFPLIVLVPVQAALVILCLFLIFHLTLAAIMGLNTFAFAFGATYPALLFANVSIASYLPHVF